jgi:glycosyltransferase involved in cell wall biosynthesis
MTKEYPRVSVQLVTYNHEKYIERALRGAIMQQTNFRYEIVISDDLSSDRTRDIIYHFKKRYPDLIRLCMPDRKLGMIENFLHTMKNCINTEYIALLDGDDYWIHPSKLQIQVNYLNKHRHCSMCFHNVLIHNEHKNNLYVANTHKIKKISTLADLIPFNFITTSSVMFRKNSINGLTDLMPQLPFYDWWSYIFSARNGTIGYIDTVMGAYRVHHGGAWTQAGRESIKTTIKKLKADVRFYNFINTHLDYKYDDLIERQINKRNAKIRRQLIKLFLAKKNPTIYKFYRTIKQGGLNVRNRLHKLPLCIFTRMG